MSNALPLLLPNCTMCGGQTSILLMYTQLARSKRLTSILLYNTQLQLGLVVKDCLGVDTAEPPGNPLIALLVSSRVNILPDTISRNVTNTIQYKYKYKYNTNTETKIQISRCQSKAQLFWNLPQFRIVASNF